MRQSTCRRSTYLPPRKDTTTMTYNHVAIVSALGVAACVLAGSTAAYITTSVSATFDSLPPIVDERTVDLPADEHGGLPRCTDAIADAGGTCWGEPLPPCPTEDSDNCYWDALAMGNGRGDSFVVEGGVVTYTEDVR
jgi:hypothetical protein